MDLNSKILSNSFSSLHFYHNTLILATQSFLHLESLLTLLSTFIPNLTFLISTPHSEQFLKIQICLNHPLFKSLQQLPAKCSLVWPLCLSSLISLHSSSNLWPPAMLAFSLSPQVYTNPYTSGSSYVLFALLIAFRPLPSSPLPLSSLFPLIPRPLPMAA